MANGENEGLNGVNGGYSDGFEGVNVRVHGAKDRGLTGFTEQSLEREGGEKSGLGVQNRPEDGDHKVGEMLRSFVELQPADDAVIGEVFRNASLGNAEVIREQRFDGDASSATAAASRDVGDGYAKRVASFDVIVGRHVVVGENEDAGAGGSTVGLIEFYGGASE